MEYTKEFLEKLINEENELQFLTFSNSDAKELGEMLYEASKEYTRTVAVEIRKNGNVIYRFIPDGATKENAAWLNAKANTVDMMGKSSLRVATELFLDDKCPEDKRMNPVEYGLLGGGFPLTVKNVGVIGTICTSGLYHTDDHKLIVDTVSRFMENHNNIQ